MAKKKSTKKKIAKKSARKPETININVDGVYVRIPLPDDVKAYFNSQFPKNTELQKKRYATLKNIVRAAYKKGLAEAKNSK